jgi:serine protease AprX
MSIATTTSTPPGSYPLVIRGISGPITRTANVTLVVINGDFAISVTPMSRTIDRGATTTYTVTITPQGFTGAVSLTLTGLPSRAAGTFNPASVTGSGTSVLTVTTERNVQKATRTLTITGSGGGHTHSVNVTLIIQ